MFNFKNSKNFLALSLSIIGIASFSSVFAGKTGESDDSSEGANSSTISSENINLSNVSSVADLPSNQYKNTLKELALENGSSEYLVEFKKKSQSTNKKLIKLTSTLTDIYKNIYIAKLRSNEYFKNKNQIDINRHVENNFKCPTIVRVSSNVAKIISNQD